MAAAAPGAQRAVTDGEDVAAEEILRDAGAAFGEIFSVAAPRDVLAGLWSGIKCVLGGAFLTLAAVISQPIEGARESGVAGCFRGVGVGLCSGMFFAITGICTGVFQAVRGVVATPRAICMASRGWKWDGALENWTEPKMYSLPEEAEQVLREEADSDDEDTATGASSSSSRAPPRTKVVDTHYYEQLGVPPGADERAIRKAYFQKSRLCHPDKTSEEGAKERFQAISEAYQVLSDPDRRRAYDAHGRQGPAAEGFIDAKVFFSVLLGADALEPYIGRLRLAEMFSKDWLGSSDDTEGGASSLVQQLKDLDAGDHRQVRRQVKLAVKLAEQLDAIAAEGRELEAGTLEKAKADAQAIVRNDRSLKCFMREIGWVYRNRADWHLAKLKSPLGSYGIRALGSRMRGRGREASQTASTAKLALRSFLKIRKIVSEADSAEAQGSEDSRPREADDDSMSSTLNSALPTFMETFWSLSSHDITGTLDKVIKRVLQDGSVAIAARCERAQALHELGSILLGVAEAAAAAAHDADASSTTCGNSAEDEMKRKRFEEAFIASMGAGSRESDDS
eukprot:TRINITY_DN6852_c0_g1_i2.p1 TRINITY_DN6852_c0_g1~~TRINITY_DN6852_c0_g1_i2.p1  ORF type:complete len:565 (-),score=138.33 TRINITY_DN6852_c0_g1_i2:44-1738(-)